MSEPFECCACVLRRGLCQDHQVLREKERDGLREELAAAKDTSKTLLLSEQRAREEQARVIDGLRATLERYASHDGEPPSPLRARCASVLDVNADCTCGYAAALERPASREHICSEDYCTFDGEEECYWYSE